MNSSFSRTFRSRSSLGVDYSKLFDAKSNYGFLDSVIVNKDFFSFFNVLTVSMIKELENNTLLFENSDPDISRKDFIKIKNKNYFGNDAFLDKTKNIVLNKMEALGVIDFIKIKDIVNKTYEEQFVGVVNNNIVCLLDEGKSMKDIDEKYLLLNDAVKLDVLFYKEFGRNVKNKSFLSIDFTSFKNHNMNDFNASFEPFFTFLIRENKLDTIKDIKNFKLGSRHLLDNYSNDDDDESFNNLEQEENFGNSHSNDYRRILWLLDQSNQILLIVDIAFGEINLAGYYMNESGEKRVFGLFNSFKSWHKGYAINYNNNNKKHNKQNIQIISFEHGEITATNFPIDIPVIPNLHINYGDGFIKYHEKIIAGLNEKKKGVVILNGTPGTGKTNYIKYLISHVNKKFIYVPSNVFEYLTKPEFINFLYNNTNKVFIIEDAEKLVLERDNSVFAGDAALPFLLNMTDGILNDFLGIQFVITFNSDLIKIDKALMRQGRMIAQYSFDRLSLEESQRFLEFNTKNKTIIPFLDEGKTLSELYSLIDDNQNISNESSKEPRKIGF